MNHRHGISLVLGVAVAGSAVAYGRSGEGDLARFQDTWQAKTGTNGEITALLKIQGKRAVAQLRQDGRELVTIRGEITLDESAVPKTFDLTEDGKAKPGYLAIYKMEGDTFTICTGDPEFGRPKEFKQGERGMPALKIYKKVNAEVGAGLSVERVKDRK